MIGRSQREATWGYLGELAIGVSFTLSPGGQYVNYLPCPNTMIPGVLNAHEYRYFAIDVITDDAVTVDIDFAVHPAVFITFTTLVCAAGPAAHFSTYNLPPPFNRDGFLVLSMPWMRLVVNNPTGNIVTMFHLSAVAWR
jgi:hypothetical protein